MEVKFEDEKQGKLQVVASPLIRLTNKPNASIEDIGNPEKLIASLGPFVTGNTYDPDELLETKVEKRGDLTVCSVHVQCYKLLSFLHLYKLSLYLFVSLCCKCNYGCSTTTMCWRLHLL